MNMKTMAATIASKNFGNYLDTVQREPVVITKKNRPVAVTFSIERARELLNIGVEMGIQKGLADVEAGRTIEITPDFITEWTAKLRAKHSVK